ncbi:MAG: hypothetical protein ACYCVH_10060 [Ignavibacteriaceae bacterium]
MWKDPIVEDVRKHRREIEIECNEDFSLLFSSAKLKEKTLKSRLVSKALKKRAKGKSKVNA